MGPKDADRIANSVDPDQTAVWSWFAQTYLSENVGSTFDCTSESGTLRKVLSKADW